MSGRLSGARVAILASNGVERVELERPFDALVEQGATVHVVSLDAGSIQGMDHDVEASREFPVDRTVADVGADDYDALVLPGGTTNPDHLRQDEAAVRFVADFVTSGKPTAAICHAPWLLIEAGVVDGRRVTSYPSVRTDLRNAGATVVDEAAVVDGNLLTSRDPDDLDAFCDSLVDLVEAAIATS